MTEPSLEARRGITPELCRKLLDYDPVTGSFRWKPRASDCGAHKAWNIKNSGKTAFTARDHGGYNYGSISNKKIRAHRAAWMMYYGEDIPYGMQIDHIDGQRGNNRIANLRLVRPVDNSRNMKKSSRNNSGCVGVTLSKRTNKWRAYIHVGIRHIALGSFHKIEDAVAARKAAEMEYGFHPNHGRSVNSQGEAK